MRASVLVKVNQFGGFLMARKAASSTPAGVPAKGQHCAVMVEVEERSSSFTSQTDSMAAAICLSLQVGALQREVGIHSMSGVMGFPNFDRLIYKFYDF